MEFIEKTDYSQAKIAELTDVFTSTVRRVAKEKMLEEEYENRFHAIISEKTRTKIWRFIQTTDYSQAKIAELIGVSESTVRRVAKEKMTAEEYKKKFQHIISEKTKKKIWRFIQTTDYSQAKIAELTGVSTTTVRLFARKKMTEKEYETRFQTVSEETKATIWRLIQTTDLDQTKIAELTGVSINTVGDVAKEIMTEEEYGTRFRTISEKTKTRIWELIQTTDLDQSKIAELTGVSRFVVGGAAKEKMTEEEYGTRFRTINKKTKGRILKLIQTTDLTLAKIAERTSVSECKVRDIAKEKMTEEEYKTRFSYKIDEEIRAIIITLINTTKKSQREIADHILMNFGVEISRSSVANFAKEVLTEEDYEKRFPRFEITILGNLFHEKATREISNWGRKRGIKVLRENKIEEILRFRKTGKRPDNVIFVDEKFRQLIHIPQHIKYIALDFSFDTSHMNFIRKVERMYQSKDTLFYFIPIVLDLKYEPKMKYQVPEGVPYEENIGALSLGEFFSLFKFTYEERKRLMDHFWDIYRESKHLKGILEFFNDN